MIGFANFYQCFIKRFNKIIVLLTSILKTSTNINATNKESNNIDNSSGDTDTKVKNLSKAKITKNMTNSKKPNIEKINKKLCLKSQIL